MALDPALLPDDVDALKRLIVGMAREAVQADTLIEKLRFELARLKRARFGASSEKIGERVEQLGPTTPFPAGGPDPDCSPTSRWRSSTTTCRSTVRPRSTPVTGWTWPPRRSPAGSVPPRPP